MSETNEGLPQIELPFETTDAQSADAVAVPSALRDVDPEKLKALKEKLRAFVVGDKKTESGSEAPVDAPPSQTPVASNQHIPTGADVDWSEYDLDFSVRHLYPQALLRQTKDGVKWVVMLDEFFSTTRAAKQYDKQVNIPGGKEGVDVEPLNLGIYLTQMVNGPEGWKIAALLPGQSDSTIVLLQRKTPHILPDPKQLVKENEHEIDAPTDEELARTEAAALDFATGIDLTAPALAEDDDIFPDRESVTITEISYDNEGNPVFRIKERLPEGREGLAVRVNLELNPGDPAPAGVQPELIELEETSVPQLGTNVLTEEGVKHVIAPGVENVRQGLAKLLDGPDFGTV